MDIKTWRPYGNYWGITTWYCDCKWERTTNLMESNWESTIQTWKHFFSFLFIGSYVNLNCPLTFFLFVELMWAYAIRQFHLFHLWPISTRKNSKKGHLTRIDVFSVDSGIFNFQVWMKSQFSSIQVLSQMHRTNSLCTNSLILDQLSLVKILQCLRLISDVLYLVGFAAIRFCNFCASFAREFVTSAISKLHKHIKLETKLSSMVLHLKIIVI